MDFQKLRYSKKKGFTLIEIMVALAIFATAATIISLSDGMSIKQTRHIKEKVLAAQLADRWMNQIHLSTQSPKTGVTEWQENYSNFNWHIQQKTTIDTASNLLKVSILVFLNNNQTKKELYQLTALFKGNNANEP